MPISVEAFRDKHVGEAAELFTINYRLLRTTIPCLPTTHESPDAAASMLSKALDTVPGAAAIRDGELVGFMFAFVIDLHGMRTAYVPDWAHAARVENSARLNQQLYTYLSEHWLRNGCYRHAITLFADDEQALDAYVRLGFGMLAIDTVRGLEPTREAAGDEVKIRRATTEDAELSCALAEELDRYLASPPTFLAYAARDTVGRTREWLSNPDNLQVLAYLGGETVGYMQFEPQGHGTAHIVSDEKSFACTGTYVKEGLRQHGIGAALLSHCAEWARQHGYLRLSVDCESANIAGSSFWLKHFTPVCYSMMRTVDERISWAHATRDARGMW